MSVLADILARESALVREFVASLGQEQKALTRGEVDVLTAITQRKNELVEQLNRVEQERSAFLRHAGHTGDQEGVSTWLASNKSDIAAAKSWSELLELATEAKRINNLNGRLIAMRLQAANQALGILTEQSHRSGLYGRDGFTTAKTGSRIIDAA